MELLYLSRADVTRLGVTMAEVLDAVDEGLRLKGLGKTETPPKPGIHPRPDCFTNAMLAYVGGIEAAGVKWVSAYPSNPPAGLPFISGLVLLDDPATGVPLAVMDAVWPTAMRTGASAGIAARYLAPTHSVVAAIVGCGVQNRHSVMALAEVLPDLREVRCYDLFSQAADAFRAEMEQRFPTLSFVLCESAAAAVRPAEVVVTAVPTVAGPHPDLDAGVLKEGALAVSLDYGSAWTPAAMRACDRFFCDDVEQVLAVKRAGHHLRGIPERIDGDLGALAAGRMAGREGAAQRIFCLNLGIAVEDVVTAKLLYDRALAEGVGARLPL